ncbi:hypothetical protein EBR96_04910, partial [bacterium]|nr:hypothetical protein [bacterium]
RRPLIRQSRLSLPLSLLSSLVAYGSIPPHTFVSAPFQGRKNTDPPFNMHRNKMVELAEILRRGLSRAEPSGVAYSQASEFASNPPFYFGAPTPS